MNLHREVHFETATFDYLASHGWLYADGTAANYDRKHALYLPDLLAWIEASQPDSWQRLVRSHGAAAGESEARPFSE